MLLLTDCRAYLLAEGAREKIDHTNAISNSSRKSFASCRLDSGPSEVVWIVDLMFCRSKSARQFPARESALILYPVHVCAVIHYSKRPCLWDLKIRCH